MSSNQPHAYCRLCRKHVYSLCLNQPHHLTYQGAPLISCENIPDDIILSVGQDGEIRRVALPSGTDFEEASSYFGE